jgi:hypothetical protein
MSSSVGVPPGRRKLKNTRKKMDCHVILPEENGLGFMHIYQSYLRSQPVICS